MTSLKTGNVSSGTKGWILGGCGHEFLVKPSGGQSVESWLSTPNLPSGFNREQDSEMVWFFNWTGTRQVWMCMSNTILELFKPIGPTAIACWLLPIHIHHLLPPSQIKSRILLFETSHNKIKCSETSVSNLMIAELVSFSSTDHVEIC